MDACMITAFTRHASNVFWNSEDVFLQHRSGTIDRFAFESDMALLRKFAEIPAYRVGWRINRDFATGEFRAFVDSLIGETTPVQFPDVVLTWKTLMTAELEHATRPL